VGRAFLPDSAGTGPTATIRTVGRPRSTRVPWPRAPCESPPSRSPGPQRSHDKDALGGQLSRSDQLAEARPASLLHRDGGPAGPKLKASGSPAGWPLWSPAALGKTPIPKSWVRLSWFSPPPMIPAFRRP